MGIFILNFKVPLINAVSPSLFCSLILALFFNKNSETFAWSWKYAAKKSNFFKELIKFKNANSNHSLKVCLHLIYSLNYNLLFLKRTPQIPRLNHCLQLKTKNHEFKDELILNLTFMKCCFSSFMLFKI
jgi:hypothetical protein